MFSYIMLLLAEGPSSEEMDVDSFLESLEMRKNESISNPTCISSVTTMKLCSVVVLQYYLSALQFCKINSTKTVDYA